MFKLSEKNSRIFLFLFVCLFSRSIPILVLKKRPQFAPLVMLFYFIIGLSFLKTFLVSKNPYGFFGGKVWWNSLRLIHSFIYLTCVLLFLTNNHYYIELLVGDLVLSFFALINNYF